MWFRWTMFPLGNDSAEGALMGGAWVALPGGVEGAFLVVVTAGAMWRRK